MDVDGTLTKDRKSYVMTEEKLVGFCDGGFSRCCCVIYWLVTGDYMMCRETVRLSASPSCTFTAGSSLSLFPCSASENFSSASDSIVAHHHHRVG